MVCESVLSRWSWGILQKHFFLLPSTVYPVSLSNVGASLKRQLTNFPTLLAVFWQPVNSFGCRPVQPLILSSQDVLGLPLLRLPSTIPYIIVFAKPFERLMWPNRDILKQFTRIWRCSCGPSIAVILFHIESLVWCAVYRVRKFYGKKTFPECRNSGNHSVPQYGTPTPKEIFLLTCQMIGLNRVSKSVF